VVMVGLPYPNIMSPELKERMEYLNLHAAKSEDGRTAGQVSKIILEMFESLSSLLLLDGVKFWENLIRLANSCLI
jgi:hypothetical protein